MTGRGAVAVLGVTGGVGRHVCAAFQQAGHPVLGIARHPADRPMPYDSLAIDLADVAPEHLAGVLSDRRIETVVNATGGWVLTDEAMHRAHVRVVERLVAASALLPVKPRIIHVGTIHEYGPVPAGTLIDEHLPPQPVTGYARTKLAGSEALLTATRAGQAQAVVLRAVNVCGPGTTTASFLGAVLKRLRDVRPGEHLPMTIAAAQRDYVDVGDLADAVVRASRAPVAGRVINIGRGVAVGIRDLVAMLVSAAGLPPDTVVEEEATVHSKGGDWTCADIRLAAELLDWHPRTGLDESLRAMWQAFEPTDIAAREDSYSSRSYRPRMTPNETDSALGSALMTLRGFQWVYGARRDPYALLLRAESDDPHEQGRRVRDAGPLTWSSAESWVTAHYRLAAQLLGDDRLALRAPERDESAPSWAMPSLDDVLPLDAAMLKLDRAQCTRLRQHVEAALDQPRLEPLRKDIARSLDQTAAELPSSFDLMTDYAYPVAVRAVAALLGVPAAQYERFASLCADAAPALDATLCPPPVETAKRLLAALAQIGELAGELVAAHRNERRDDVLGEVIAAAGGAPGEAVDPVPVAVLFAVAGVELAAVVTANTVSALLAEPSLWAKLAGDPERATDAVAEGLRFAPPVRLQRLVASANLEIEECAVTAGSQIVLLTEAANRDPAAFPAPDRFDLDRPVEPPPLWAHPALPTGVVGEFVRRHAADAIAALARHVRTLHSTGAGYSRLRSPVTGTPLSRPVAV